MDLYRIDEPEDTFELGLSEILDGDGLCVVEWAEKAIDQFSADRLTIKLVRTGEESRRLEIQAIGAYYARYLHEIDAIGLTQQKTDQTSSGLGH